MAKRWAVAIFVVFLAVLILTLLCYAGLNYLFNPRERSVSLKYIINIWPKEGESPKDVTVYLPFPYLEGKPIEKVFVAMEHEFNEFVRDDYPEATIELVSTKYDKMVKIEIQELGIGIGFGADPLDPQYGPCFKEPASLPPPSTRYLLNPRFDVKKLAKNQISYTWIYLDYKEATGIILRSQYIVKHRSQSRIGGFFGWHPSGGDFLAFIGTDNPPRDSQGRLYSRPAEVEINEKGWIKIPIYEVGYGSR